MYPHNRYAPTNILHPDSQAICDRCGYIWNRRKLVFQYDYRGGKSLTNLRILVCPRCLDRPQPQLQPKNTPPDPVPIKNPRPPFWAAQEGPPPPDIPVYLLVPDNDGGGPLNIVTWTSEALMTNATPSADLNTQQR